MRKCNSCGALLKDDVLFCTSCGNELPVLDQRRCSHCGSELKEDRDFCSSCGSLVASPEKKRRRKTQQRRRMSLKIVVIFLLLGCISIVGFLGWTSSKSYFLNKVEKAFEAKDVEEIRNLLLEKDGKRPTVKEMTPFLRLMKEEGYKNRVLRELKQDIPGDFSIVKKRKFLLLHEYDLNWTAYSFDFKQLRAGKLNLEGEEWETKPNESLKIDYLFPGIFQGKITFDGIEIPWEFTFTLSATNEELQGVNKTWDFSKRFFEVQLPDQFKKAYVIIDGKETGKQVEELLDSKLGPFLDEVVIELLLETKAGKLKSEKLHVTSETTDLNIEFSNLKHLDKSNPKAVVELNGKIIGLVEDFKDTDYYIGPVYETDTLEVKSP